MTIEAPQEKRKPIPKLIKRNIIFLSSGQAVSGAGFQLVPAIAGLIMLKMTGSLALVGFTIGIIGLTRIAISYPIGRVADNMGRRPALLIGLLTLSLGAITIFFSVITDSFWLFIVGLVLQGLGQGAIHQMRVAATDMFPIERKAEGVSYIMTGSIFGAIGGPLIVAFATGYAKEVQMDPYASPWLFTPLLAIISAVFVIFTRPDPLQIAQNLDKYYPNVDKKEFKENPGGKDNARVISFLSHYPILVALLVTAITWGNMSMMMSLVSVVLNHHGFDLNSISIAVGIHILGMFGLSIPLGRLADRWGRRRILIFGSIISGVAALTTTVFQDYLTITLGIFLVGLGWSAAMIASTAIVGDVSPPLFRGRVLGTVELVSGASTLALPIIAGYVTNLWGFLALGLMGSIVIIPALIVSALLRETSPGVYDHQSPIR